MSLDKFKEAIAALVLVALVIAALALALDGFQDGIEEDLVSVTSGNESFSYTNATSASLNIDCFSGISCSAVVNGTTGVLIGSGNYTCSDRNITVYDNDVGGVNSTYGWASTLYVIYSCNPKDYAYNVTEEGLEGISNSSSYLSTIGTLLGVAALIAVVIMAFYFVRR